MISFKEELMDVKRVNLVVKCYKNNINYQGMFDMENIPLSLRIKLNNLLKDENNKLVLRDIMIGLICNHNINGMYYSASDLAKFYYHKDEISKDELNKIVEIKMNYINTLNEYKVSIEENIPVINVPKRISIMANDKINAYYTYKVLNKFHIPNNRQVILDLFKKYRKDSDNEVLNILDLLIIFLHYGIFNSYSYSIEEICTFLHLELDYAISVINKFNEEYTYQNTDDNSLTLKRI